MQLQVHTVSVRNHILEVEQNWTIAAIKEDLQRSEGISLQRQRLVHAGQNSTDQTITEVVHIQPGEVLHMVLALRAGF
jgi:hypothetical protein